MGEEGADTPGTSGRRWIVDPLDGTINFLYGIPQWAVSVACEGVAGAVFDPMPRRALRRRRRAARELNGEALEASRCDDLAQALVATGFGYEARRAPRAGARSSRGSCRACATSAARARAALDLAWAAAGRLDAFYEFGVKPWDIAAGTLLCSAAGLEVRELQASDALPAGVLVAPPALVEPLLALVCLIGRRVQQRPRAVRDLLGQRDVARRAPDRRVGERAVDDVLQVLGVARHDAAEQVARAAGRRRLEHLGHLLEHADGLLELSLGDLQEDERHQRVAHPVRVELGAEAAHDAALGQLRQAGLDGAAGDLQAARDLHEPDAGLVAEERDQAGIKLVHRTGHIV